MTIRALFYVEQNYSFAILRPLQKEILQRGGEVRWFFVGNDANTDYLNSEEEKLSSLKEAIAWQPKVVFVPGNYVTSKLPGLKVEVFHGFDSGKVNRKGQIYHFEIRHCFDLYCTHGPLSTAPFKELQAKYRSFDVKETGWPAVDPLFWPESDNPFVTPDDPRPVVLFCSTHSPRFSCAETLFDEVNRIADEGKYRWLIQFHPMMSEETVAKYKAIRHPDIQFVETDNVLPLLRAADVMLCDTSAVLLMYLAQIKPVVTFKNQHPGDHLIDIQEPEALESALQLGLDFPKELQEKIENYCTKMHPYRDGASSARVIDAVCNMLEANTKQKLHKKPANWWREFKERRKLSG